MEEEALDQYNKACQILPNIKFHRENCKNFFTDFFRLDLKENALNSMQLSPYDFYVEQNLETKTKKFANVISVVVPDS